jgi:chemotaxis protein methyltransferase CheR
LDEELRVIAASRSFYQKFGLTHEATRDLLFYDLGNGEWNDPALKKLLEAVIPEHTTVEDYEVVHDFITLGSRIMLVNACEIRYENGRKKMLLSIFDVTEQRHIETELKQVIAQKDLLLKEMQHRIANSLQLIASILMLKADRVSSDEVRQHLEETQERIMSIAIVQRQLGLTDGNDRVQVAHYLTTLCESVARSMIGGRKPIQLVVNASSGTATADETISFGLITTELVINSLKYAFPQGEGIVNIDFHSSDEGWTLTVSDDGVGYAAGDEANQQGLGTSIVISLARQLHAELHRESVLGKGTTVSLSYPATRLF